MLNEILKEIGIPSRESRFIKTPAAPFIVYFDAVESRGADNVNLIREHGVTFELYTDKNNDLSNEAIAKVESVLDARGIPYTKSERNYIEAESYYQTVFDFDYVEKREV